MHNPSKGHREGFYSQALHILVISREAARIYDMDENQGRYLDDQQRRA
jgi:hypothetical protein